MSDWNGFAKIIFNVVYIFDKCYWNTNKKKKTKTKSKTRKKHKKIDKQKIDSQTEKQKFKTKRVYACWPSTRCWSYLYGINFCIIKILDKL